MAREEEEIEKMKKQAAQIHLLAKWVPWLVVGAVILTTLFYISLALFNT